MNPLEASCFYCGQPVDLQDDYTWQRIEGWQRIARDAPSRRGGSSIVCRETQEVFAHNQCVRRQQTGVNPTQETLV